MLSLVFFALVPLWYLNINDICDFVLFYNVIIVIIIIIIIIKINLFIVDDWNTTKNIFISTNVALKIT